jgi:predicted Zn-dependent peptidase
MYTGNLKNINNFKRKDIVDFIKNNYLPNKTIYVVSGNVELKDIEILINKHLTTEKQPNLYQKSFTKIIRDNPIKIDYTDSDSITVNYGFLTVDKQNNDSHTLELLEYLLGRGLGCRFNQTVTRKGLTYYVMTRTQHLSDTGYFLINFTVQKENLNKTLEIINQQLTDIKTGGFSDKELKRAKAYFIGQLLVNNETTDALASWYGYQAVGNPKKIFSIKDKQSLIKKITKKDLIKVANKYFNKDNWYLSAIGPIKEKNIKITNL